MDYIAQFQINFFSFFTLMITAILVNRRITLGSYSKRMLNALIIFTGVAIIFEPLTWIFDQGQFVGAHFLEYFTNYMLFLLAPIIAGLMISYVSYYVEKDIKTIKRRFYYQLPALITFVILFFNFFFSFYFSVEVGTNKYSQGNLDWIHYTIILIMYLYMVFIIIKQRKFVSKKITNMFMMFFFLPLLGMIIQIFNSRILFTWNSLVLSIFVIYVFVESTNTEKDYLSKIFNRFSFEKYTKMLGETSKDFKLISFDLDKFKNINDTYGHLEGDKTLVEFSRILEHACKPNRMVARLGGDEFMVVIEDNLETTEIVNRIYEQLKVSNSQIMNQLTFSYGSYRKHDSLSIDELYLAVDREMYEFKKKNNISDR